MKNQSSRLFSFIDDRVNYWVYIDTDSKEIFFIDPPPLDAIILKEIAHYSTYKKKFIFTECQHTKKEHLKLWTLFGTSEVYAPDDILGNYPHTSRIKVQDTTSLGEHHNFTLVGSYFAGLHRLIAYRSPYLFSGGLFQTMHGDETFSMSATMIGFCDGLPSDTIVLPSLGSIGLLNHYL